MSLHRLEPAEGNRPSTTMVTFRDNMRSGLWFPLFDELADPVEIARLAAEAEERGWHGVFVWDHLRWRAPIRQVADPWITLAAVASATENVRLGPMVTPLARRRPVKVARETAALDLLSKSRLVFGVGLGGERFVEEFSKTGEELDDRVRGEMLDEGLEILTAAWSGEPVNHLGKHYLIDDVQFLPRPVQRPGVPVWAVACVNERLRWWSNSTEPPLQRRDRRFEPVTAHASAGGADAKPTRDGSVGVVN